MRWPHKKVAEAWEAARQDASAWTTDNPDAAREPGASKAEFQRLWTKAISESGWTREEFHSAMDLISAAQAGMMAKDPFWPRPAVRALESRREGLGLEWASRSCLLALEAQGDPKGLAEEVRHLEKSDPCSLASDSERIWYLPEGRDAIQTAVANLYAAAHIAACEGRRLRYLLTVSSCLFNVAESPGGQSAVMRALEELP